MALDERLHRELERAARPADPTGIYEDLLRRRGRRQVVRRAQRGLLAFAVIVGSIAGVYGLTRVFEASDTRIGVDPSPVPIVPHTNGLIAYSSVSADGSIALHTVRDDGSDDRVIVTPPGDAWAHSWSPDGSRLAVFVHPPGDGETGIWLMNADGSAPVQIVSAQNIGEPSWSPDGSSILYTTRAAGRAEIRIVGADGTGDRLVHGERAEGTFGLFSARFSPDGRRILFDRGTDSGFDIFVMNVDGSEVRPLTTTGTDYDPHWSPDGAQIAFTREEIVEGRATSDIFVMNADGGDVRRLTDGGNRSTNLSPQWAPDGTKIVYIESVTGGPGPLVVMNVDGSDPRTLVEEEALTVSWQPLPATGSSPPEPSTGIGLGFPVCNVSSIEADFVAGGGTESAYVATRRGDVGGCPQPEEAFNVVALDTDGDGQADSSYGPIECELECRAFSAPDIDGDGTTELLVVQSGGSVVGLGLFDITLADGAPAIFPVMVAPPGDPEAGFEPGEAVRLLLGGDEFYLYTLRCGDPEMRDGPGLVVTAAESLPHDSPDAEWHAHRITFALRDGMLDVVDVGDFTEPAGFDAPSFQSGETLCGSNLGP